MKIRSFYHLPLSSLQWLLTGLFLAAIPLWVALPAAMLFGFLGCLLWRFILERKGLKCPGLWLRCGVGVAGLLMIIGLHGTLFGLTAGMGLLLLLVALKVLEMRSEREFMLLGFLAYFILLTALFFSQTLLMCAYVIAVFLVLTATIVQFTGGAVEGFRSRPLLRYTGMLALQALPLVILFFIFLPRLKGGAWLKISKPQGAQSGMSDQIKPGSIAELAESEEVAFRVDFPEQKAPRYEDLYWRVAVFADCQGMNWFPDKRQHELRARPVLTGPLIVQRISMEPHTGGWAYALDRPLDTSSRFVGMTAGNVLSMNAPIRERLNIVVRSQLGNDQTPLSDRARLLLQQTPDRIAPKSRQLVNSWLQRTQQPAEIVRLALAMFRNENFRYTLSPGTYSGDALDEFLFERKLGFCEHYSAAFATLMRMAGLPARVVAGYHGGESNQFGDYLIVRQSNAHAWAEVWIEGEGWVRFDPADAINPLRVDADTMLSARLAQNSESAADTTLGKNGRNFLENITHNFQLGWDTVNFQWNLHVVSYDQDSQRDFYRSLGIRSLFSWRLLTILLGGILLVLGLIYLLVRAKTEKTDHSLRIYREFCELLHKRGLDRLPNEGPRDFSWRAMRQFPEQAEKLAGLFESFIQQRYGTAASPAQEPKIRAQLRELQRLLPKNQAATAALSAPAAS